MQITELPAAPDPFNDTAEEFGAKAAAFVQAQQALVPELNQKLTEFAANLNAIAAGSAYAIPYTFDSGTTDADPGAGKLRLSSATQNAATVLRLDLTSAGGQDFASIIDTFDASTSTVKGSIRLVKLGDATKWLTFDVTARATATGYRNITVTNTGGSAASPFANGDGLILLFQRTGDKGEIGLTGASGFSNIVVLTTSQTWTAPAGSSRPAEVTVIDGGSGGESSSGGSTSDYSFRGGKGGDSGVSVVTLTSGGVYTATVGAGGAGGTFPSTGGSSSFAGPGITTLTTSNATVRSPGATGQVGSTDFGVGGGTLYAPTGSTGYGAGGRGGSGAGGALPGKAGVVIIRY